MKTRVQRWGNSLAVRIPKPYAVDLGLEPDAPVELAVEDGCIIIRPSTAGQYELSELLAKVTEDNLHPEHDFGDPVGSEKW